MTASLFILETVIFISAVYLLTGNRTAVLIGLLYAVLAVLCIVLLITLIRRKLLLFSNTFCELLDQMMAGNKIELPEPEEESLFYKIIHRLLRLYEIMGESHESVAKERSDLQELISDISHQVKTPITNLKMVNATLLEQEVPKEKRIRLPWIFLAALIVVLAVIYLIFSVYAKMELKNTSTLSAIREE